MPLTIDPSLFIDTVHEGLLCLNQITCVGVIEENGAEYRFFITVANGTVFMYSDENLTLVEQKRAELLQRLGAALNVPHPLFEMFEGHMSIPLISMIFPIVESGRFYGFQVMMGTTSIFFSNYSDTYEEAEIKRNRLIEWYQLNNGNTSPTNIDSDDNYYV
jgi:hypothetical protein